MPEHCLNCETAIKGDFKHCPECGQKTDVHRFSLHEILHEGIHYFTHADKGFFQLIRSLVIKTGSVAREYVAGKRKKYFAPLNFFLLVATIFVILISLVISRKPPINVLRQFPGVAAIRDPAVQKRVVGYYERSDKAVRFVSKYSNFIAMVAVPLIGLLFWLFFINAKYNYSEHLVACMYMIGFTNLVYSVVFLPLNFIAPVWSLTGTITFKVFEVFYYSIFYYQFMGKQRGWAVSKVIATSLVAVAAWFALTYLVMDMYIKHGK